jgi:hypothetical protein
VLLDTETLGRQLMDLEALDTCDAALLILGREGGVLYPVSKANL